MYYDESFDPNIENEFSLVPHFDETYSIANSVTTMNSNTKKYLKQLELLKMQDKDYRKIDRYFNGKKKSIELYATNSTPGTRIRDATSGSRINNAKVGSRDEDMFYKVAICTAEKGISGADSNIFFFDTPENYERITGATVSPQDKSRWEEKYTKERVKRQ